MGMICEVFIIPAHVAKQISDAPAQIHELLESVEDSDALSLEKSWHGLHYVFTGTASEGEAPLNFLVSGGETLGDEDVGYGRPNIDPAGVVKIRDALASFSPEHFDLEFFDRDGLSAAGDYPQIWDEPLDELKQEYDGYLQALKSHVNRASLSGQALLIAIR